MGAKPKAQTVGFRYYFDIHFALGKKVDEVCAIRASGKTAWKGSITSNGQVRINAPELFGGDKGEGGLDGTLDVLFGEEDQGVLPRLAAMLGGLVPAQPSTAAISGLPMRTICRTSRALSCIRALPAANSVTRMSPRSPPAQNTSSPPVSSTLRIDGSHSAASRARSNSMRSAGDSALRRAGLSKRSRRTVPRVSCNKPLIRPPPAVAATLLDNRLILNGNLFWTVVHGYQANAYDEANRTQYLTNAGDVRSRGLEFEATALPIRGLTLNFNASYNDVRYLSYKNAPCAPEVAFQTGAPASCDLSGHQVVGASKYIANLNGEPVGHLQRIAGAEGRPLMAPREPGVLKRAVLWLLFLGPFFFASYGLANWLTSQRGDVGSLAFDWERGMPLWPWTILPYWSIDLLYGLSLLLPRDKRELDTHCLRLLSAQVLSVTAQHR